MSNEEDRELMQRIQQKLINFDAEPPPMAWQAIQQKLNGGEPYMPKSALPSAVRISAVVALFVGLSVLFWFLQKPKETEKVQKQSVSNAKPELTKPVESVGIENPQPVRAKAILQTKSEKILNINAVEEIFPANQLSEKETETTIDNTQTHSKELEMNAKLDTTIKISKKHINFYEKMRQDTALKKQELFK